MSANHRKANKFPDIGVPGDPRTLAAIERRTPNLSTGFTTHVFGSTILEPKPPPRKTPGLVGNFYTIIAAEDGRFLQPGTVNGIAVPMEDLKIFDSLTSELEGEDGYHLYLEIEGIAYIEDDVLLSGFDVDLITAVIGAPPGHTLPTIVSEGAGTCIASLGVFQGNRFYPSGIGDINVSFCPGNFTVVRTQLVDEIS